MLLLAINDYNLVMGNQLIDLIQHFLPFSEWFCASWSFEELDDGVRKILIRSIILSDLVSRVFQAHEVHLFWWGNVPKGHFLGWAFMNDVLASKINHYQWLGLKERQINSRGKTKLDGLLTVWCDVWSFLMLLHHFHGPRAIIYRKINITNLALIRAPSEWWSACLTYFDLNQI